MRALAEKYFASLPPGPLPPTVHTVEPEQAGPRKAEVESPSQPLEVMVYKRPSQYDKDDPVFDVISGILSGGRTAILYKEMVRDKKIAVAAGTEAGFPGDKYPSLFLFYLVPAVGHTVDENQKLLNDILERFKKQKVDAETLARVKTKTRASLIRRLDNNADLAQMLTSYYVAFGDWRKLFTSIDDIDKVTADDVQRVARTYFITNARTVAFNFQPPAPSAQKPEAGEGEKQ